MRDRTVGETFYMFFTTRAFATGIPTVLAGTPVVSAYEDNSITQITAGITLGVDHDGVVGLNLLTLVATGANGYEAGKDYSMVITTGTVSSVSVVGEVVGEFSLGLSSAFTRIGAAGAGLTDITRLLGHTTTIATLASQTSFTLTAGSADDDAYNGFACLVIDVSTGTQLALGKVLDYTGSTKTITLNSDPGIFTMATTDNVLLLPGFTTETLVVDLSATAKTDINTEVDTALTDIHLDHLLAADYNPASKPGTATALLNELIEDDGGVSRYTVNALEQGPSGTGASASVIADAVWDESQGDHVTAGSFGVTATEIADILTDTGTTLDAAIAVVDSNVDSILVDTGTTLDAALAVVDANVDQIETAVITNAAGADVAADIIALKAETVLIVADTNELQTDDIPGSLTTLQSDTDDIQTRLPSALVGGRMDSDVEAINNNTTAADNLGASALGIVTGACEGTPTITVVQTNLSEATDDHYVGRVVVFTSGVAAGEATDITVYTGSTGTLTITALTTAPVATDTFVIV